MIGRHTPREGVLMSLTFSSGVVDAISFIAFGKVFSAFMTGNLVFLGLGAANAFKPGGPNLVRVGAVLVAFALGAFIAARGIRRLRGTRLQSRTLSLALGGVLLLQVAFLAAWLVVSGHPSATSATCLAVVEAIAMGMQSSAVGSLDVKGVFTTAATATLINLSREVADRRVSSTDPARMLRILVCLIAGALVGGLLLVNARTFAPVVPPLATALAIAGSVAEVRAVRRGAPADWDVFDDSHASGLPLDGGAASYPEAA
jgi:uncharacterized membrane protein YoaK (UPF0700 family)